MTITTLFDWLFVNQLFGTRDLSTPASGNTERGQTIYYPNGLAGRGYLVPPEREASVRAAVRRLVLVAMIGTLVLVSLVPRVIEGWIGFSLPLGWFIGGALVALVVIVGAIIHCLKRLTAGLEPASG
jgi:hypothetical protein